MPSSITAKIESARKQLIGAAVVLCILLAIIASSIFISLNRQQPYIAINGHRFNVEIAAKEASRQQGLSGRRVLAEGDAMLFLFDTADTQCFWMKDMQFNIDIVWINTDEKVAYIEKNVTPQTYPRSFCPSVPANKVVELASGVSEKVGIRVGDKLTIKL